MQEFNSAKPWIIAITGASGTCYARKLIELLLNNFPQIKLEIIFSEAGLRVLREEDRVHISLNKDPLKELIGPYSLLATQKVTIHNNRDIGASIASGSYLSAGMVIVPCSMKTLAALAHGYAENLIQRAADVILKEKRRLIIVPRETPLSEIHLENMLRLAKLDVRVIPAMPGFYQQPKEIADLVEHFCFKILDQMGLELDSASRWKSADKGKNISGVEIWKK